MKGELDDRIARYEFLGQPERIQVWIDVRNLALRSGISPELLAKLNGLLRLELNNGETWREAVTTMFAVLPSVRKEIEHEAKRRWLHELLWGDFHNPSIVLGVEDATGRRRDERASLVLRGHLGVEEFPKTEFQFIRTDAPHGVLILAGEKKALCITGRLSLYSPEARARWRATDDLRFALPNKRRPRFRPRSGNFDPSYYHIREQASGQRSPRYYLPAEEKSNRAKMHKRTDYALVQRYVAKDFGKSFVVVLVAGSTWSGTEGAAWWAAIMLPHPEDGQTPIPLPKKYSLDSRIEALLRVTTDLDAAAGARPEVEIVKLFVGDWEWNAERQVWRKQIGGDIKVLFDAKTTRPVAMEVGNRVRKFRGRSLRPRLVATLLQLTRGKNGAVVDLDRMARHMSTRTKKFSPEEVRRLLWLLVRHWFPGAISFQGPPRLEAEFRRVQMRKPPAPTRPESNTARSGKLRRKAPLQSGQSNVRSGQD
jgi:hypothetical protein